MVAIWSNNFSSYYDVRRYGVKEKKEIEEELDKLIKSINLQLSDKKLPDGCTMKEFSEHTKFGRESLLCTRQQARTLQWVLSDN